jgi:hypothetical protein
MEDADMKRMSGVSAYQDQEDSGPLMKKIYRVLADQEPAGQDQEEEAGIYVLVKNSKNLNPSHTSQKVFFFTPECANIWSLGNLSAFIYSPFYPFFLLSSFFCLLFL